MTRYERIQCMTIEEMATLFYTIIADVENRTMRAVSQQLGCQVDIITPSPELCIQTHIKHLSEEYDEGKVYDDI